MPGPEDQNSTAEQTNNGTEGHDEHQSEELQGQEQGSSQKASLFDDGDKAQGGHDVQSVQGKKQDSQDVQPALTAEDIKIPDGYEYDKTLGDDYLGIVNKYKISKEAAQELFDLYQSQNLKTLEGLKAAEAERAKKFEADMAAEKAEWLKQCEADKEFGGQNWDSNQAVIDRAAKSFDGAVKVMQAYNLNTHPEIVRMFYRTGLLMGEDQSRTAGGSAKVNDPAMAIFGESLKEYHKRRGD